MRAALVGNYGVGNLGDEALREYFLGAFPEVEWKVLSASPKAGEYARLPGGIRSFLGFRWFKTLRMIKGVDVLVFGGGSLFTDVESPFACFLWWIHAMAAWIFRKPIVLAFQGTGPYKTKRGEWFARSVVRQSAFISVRDEESFRRIENWDKSTKVEQTFDPVFSIMVNKKIGNDTKNVFIIIPRKNSSAMFLDNVYKKLENNTWQEVRIVLMEGRDESERKIASDILSKVGSGIGQVLSVQTLDELMQSLDGATLVCAQRFHGALAAIAADVALEVYPQGEGDKLSIAARAADRGVAGKDELLSLVKAGADALHAWFAAGT